MLVSSICLAAAIVVPAMSESANDDSEVVSNLPVAAEVRDTPLAISIR